MATSSDARVAFLKMKADYHRYSAEFQMESNRRQSAESSLIAYKSAQVPHHGSRLLVLVEFLCTFILQRPFLKHIEDSLHVVLLVYSFENMLCCAHSHVESLVASPSPSQPGLCVCFQDVAEKTLPPTNPMRLSVALNLSVFYYDILNCPHFALEVAQEVGTFL